MRYETENQCQGTAAEPEPAKPRSGAAPGSVQGELQRLRELRRRCHNIATGAEPTADDNKALILIAGLCEDSHSPNNKLSEPPTERNQS